jgi:4'-phosphopantetheinyl transferase
LHFNVSHSEDFAVIAISRDKSRVDIEFKSAILTMVLSVLISLKIKLNFIENAANKTEAFLYAMDSKLCKAVGKGIDEDFKNIPCLDGQHF